jgi:hypothetical protein
VRYSVKLDDPVADVVNDHDFWPEGASSRPDAKRWVE